MFSSDYSYYTYYRVCIKSKTTGAISGTGATYLSGLYGFSPEFYWGSCCSFGCSLCSVLQIVVCPFPFGHCIVCPLPITTSNYHFGIFKAFMLIAK